MVQDGNQNNAVKGKRNGQRDLFAYKIKTVMHTDGKPWPLLRIATPFCYGATWRQISVTQRPKIFSDING